MPKHSAPGLLGRLVNRPLLASPDLARFYFSYLAERRGGENWIVDGGIAHATKDIVAVGKYRYGKDANVPMVPGTGIAVIEVTGSLTHKLGNIDPSSGMTGYDGIEFKLQTAAADPNVKGILFDIHSGGGEVSGAFDLADQIGAIAKQKPVWAVADEHAFSAAYLIASQATRITAPRTGEVGSIGVIMMHSEMSRALANEGVKVTLIKAGARKADMNPFEPLSEATIAKIQAEIDGVYGMFVAAVAKGRDITQESVRGTAADVYTAADAQQLGLIDAVQSANDTYAEFAASLAAPARSFSFPATAPAGTKGADQQPKEILMDPAEVKTAPAPAAVAAPAAPATDSVQLERERVLAIQTMAQTGEETLAGDLIANGSSIAVATTAFAQKRRELREANAAVRRSEAPRPLAAASPALAAEIDQRLPVEQRAKLEWDSDKNLHVEFGGSFTRYKAYRAAEERGDVARIKRGTLPKAGAAPL